MRVAASEPVEEYNKDGSVAVDIERDNTEDEDEPGITLFAETRKNGELLTLT